MHDNYTVNFFSSSSLFENDVLCDMLLKPEARYCIGDATVLGNKDLSWMVVDEVVIGR
jgi:hypothetical protein